MHSFALAQNPVVDGTLEAQIALAQAGEHRAVEALLEQFRPLLRSRMHRLWTALRENVSTLEWGDVESQVTLLFLSRLQRFEPEQGVYFPHYIERMLDFDGRAWLREQRRGMAVPFSQLSTTPCEEDDLADWLLPAQADEARETEQNLSLRDALEKLPDGQRRVVWQCCVLGRTEHDVADEMRISRSTVRNRLESGLGQMRVYFGTQDQAATRTGRSAIEKGEPMREFWSFSFRMSKDLKRPDLVGVGAGSPVLLQGIFEFLATGLKTPQLLSPKLRYTVPQGCVAGIRFFRAGIICEKMVCLSTVVNGMPHRLIPIAANASEHIAFAMVEPLCAGSELEIHIAADAPGTAIVDVGCLQMPA